jgi:hypothetical protein
MKDFRGENIGSLLIRFSKGIEVLKSFEKTVELVKIYGKEYSKTGDDIKTRKPTEWTKIEHTLDVEKGRIVGIINNDLNWILKTLDKNLILDQSNIDFELMQRTI